MKVLFFGSYAPLYSRNKILREGLRMAGAEVLECNVPFEEGRRFHDRYRSLLRKLVNLGGGWDVMVVPEFNHKNMPLAFVAARACKKPLVFDPLVSFYDTNVEDRERVAPGGKGALAQLALDKAGFGLAHTVWADTSEHARYFHQKYRVPLPKLRVVPVGADDECFHPHPAPQNNGSFVVAFWGSYVPLHGIEHILKAAHILRSESGIRFKLIGAGQTFASVNHIRERLHLENVEISGWVPYRKLAETVADADVCLGIFGGTDKAGRVVPNKVFSSLAMRKPVLTGDSPAIREIFQSGVHLLSCTMADAAALAEGIRLLVDSPTLRETLAQCGHEYAMERFSRRAIGQRAREILEEIVEARNR